MVRDLILPDHRRDGGWSVGSPAAMVTLLVPLFRLVAQPEVIRDHESN